MKLNVLAPTLFSLITLAGAAFAEEKTVTLEVSELYCSSCPYIAAQAIMEVESANIVDGWFDPDLLIAQYVVQFDDSISTLDQIVGATSEYGYPAILVENAS